MPIKWLPILLAVSKTYASKRSSQHQCKFERGIAVITKLLCANLQRKEPTPLVPTQPTRDGDSQASTRLVAFKSPIQFQPYDTTGSFNLLYAPTGQGSTRRRFVLWASYKGLKSCTDLNRVPLLHEEVVQCPGALKGVMRQITELNLVLACEPLRPSQVGFPGHVSH